MKSVLNFTEQSPLICQPYHSTETCVVDKHLHDTYEIFQAISDNIQYFIEGKAYRLSKGDLILTSSNVIHRPSIIDDTPYVRRFIQFSPELIKEWEDIDFSPLRLMRDRRSTLISLNPLQKDEVYNYFKDIHNLLKNATPISYYQSRLKLIEFLIFLSEVSRKDDKRKKRHVALDPRVKSLLTYLDGHFRDKFDLEKVSNALILDKYYMSHLFKQHTGMTLLEYVQSKRIQLAKNLMAKDMTMNEICFRCGYEDYSNFYKSFKKLMLCSPTHYRKSLSINKRF